MSVLATSCRLEFTKMKLKKILRSTLAGVVTAMTCYFSLISPATHAALALRRSMPDAWFSSSVTWYALGAVLLASAAIAVVVSRKVYKLESMDIRATSNPSDVEGHSS